MKFKIQSHRERRGWRAAPGAGSGDLFASLFCWRRRALREVTLISIWWKNKSWNKSCSVFTETGQQRTEPWLNLVQRRDAGLRSSCPADPEPGWRSFPNSVPPPSVGHLIPAPPRGPQHACVAPAAVFPIALVCPPFPVLRTSPSPIAPMSSRTLLWVFRVALWALLGASPREPCPMHTVLDTYPGFLLVVLWGLEDRFPYQTTDSDS